MKDSTLNSDKLLGDVVGFVNENKPIYQATEEIKVRLIDWQPLIEKLKEQDDDLRGKDWEIRSGNGIVFAKEKPILIDDECCGAESVKRNILINGTCYTATFINGVGIFNKREQTDGGYSISMFPDFYVDLDYAEVEKCLTGEEVELWKFMGQRYEYNPRIHKNLREIVKLYKGEESK